jgi:hypothetical protein
MDRRIIAAKRFLFAEWRAAAPVLGLPDQSTLEPGPART